MITKEYVTAGDAYFTVEPAKADIDRLGLKPHYTYRIQRPKPKDGDEDRVAPFFGSVLTGPNNLKDYSYMGIVDMKRVDPLVITKASKFGPKAWEAIILRRLLRALCEGRAGDIEAAGWVVMHDGFCGRCRRRLTVPASVQTGVGPECEILVFAGFVHLCEIPQYSYPEVAKLQAAYWMKHEKDIDRPLYDACLDYGLDDVRAKQIVTATIYAMRKFKMGKDWPDAFKRVVG